MRPVITALVGTLLACVYVNALACEPSQRQTGCKISAGECTCYYGCKADLVYKTRQECLNALQERRSNACGRQPCRRGTCTQTALSPGFACKCEGTGFYGNYCEKACPTGRLYGQVFPHVCVVI